MDIYVVSEAKVLPYLKDAYFDTQLPILPPEINRVKISWMGPDDKVSLSVRACVRLSVRLPVCLSVCPSVRLVVRVFVCRSVCQFNVSCPSTCWSSAGHEP